MIHRNTPEALSEFMTRGQTEEEYAVVSIMGVQSSGKSTLLNKLFGTRFHMMDATQGRSQTTLGIWLDSAVEAPHITVMDLEGTDSGERGEDRTTFERQTTLYALALSEVLIINLWETDIGRYTASNYGILKTVFEVNLQLFDNPSKTLILFVVRDHIEEDTPARLLKDKLLREVNRIWDEMEKPPAFERSPITNFFDFDFSALPHMKLQKVEFQQAIDDLRSRFNDKTNPRYLFSSSYHGDKTVPTDGFGIYAQNIWEAIQNAEALNLPSQKEMLATYRCDELCRIAVDTFQASFSDIEALCSGPNPVKDFGSRSSSLVERVLSEYDNGAKKYVTSIVQQKRQILVEQLVEKVHPLFQSQMNHAVHSSLKQLKEECDEVFSNPTHPIDNFQGEFERLQSVCEERVLAAHAQVSVGVVQWPSTPFIESLLEGVTAVREARREQELTKLRNQVRSQIKKQLITNVSRLLCDVEHNFAPLLVKAISAFVKRIESSVSLPLKGLRCSPEETASLVAEFTQMAQDAAMDDVVRHAEIITQKMRDRFDALFRYGSDGLPRQWSRVKMEQIREWFVEGKQHALEMLSWYESIPIASDEGSTTSVITPEKKEQVIRDFNDRVETALREAEAEYVGFFFLLFFFSFFFYCLLLFCYYCFISLCSVLPLPSFSFPCLSLLILWSL